MYLMDQSIASLNKFITGYMISFQINCPDKTERFFDKFNDWVAKVNNNSKSYHSWYTVIMDECNNDERVALEKFWGIWKDYLEIASKLML